MFRWMSILAVSLVLVSCGLLKDKDKDKPQSVAGWWEVTEVVQGGTRYQLPIDQRVLVGFNDSFQMYSLDGSDPDCSGKGHGYEVTSSGNISVKTYLSLEPLAICTSKSARVKRISGQTLVLGSVKFSDKLICEEATLKSVSMARVNTLYSYAFSTRSTSDESTKSSPGVATTTTPVTTSESTTTTTVPEGRVARPDLTTDKENPVREVHVNGYYVVDHYLLDGVRYAPGDPIEIQGQKGKLPKTDMMLHFEDGKFIQYINGGSVAKDYVKYEIVNRKLQAAEAGYQRQSFEFVSTTSDTLRMRGFIPYCDIVFKRVGEREAKELLKNNSTFQKLKGSK